MVHTAPTLAPDSSAISGVREPTGKGFRLVSFPVFWLNFSLFNSRPSGPHVSRGLRGFRTYCREVRTLAVASEEATVLPSKQLWSA